MGKKLGLAPERVVVTVDRHANTSAASIPLALADAEAAGKFQRGDVVLMEAIGGGLTWGSALARWYNAAFARRATLSYLALGVTLTPDDAGIPARAREGFYNE